MPETIYKLQPNRNLHLRGFDDRGAAAALHSTSATGFTVSGVFRDSADFAVLILYDADDFFAHPRMKYLPDFDLSGLVLQFDVLYDKLQPLDSPKFPTIDWPFLDGARSDGSAFKIPLFAHASLSSGGFTAATGSFTIQTPGAAAFDRVTLWYQNIAFDVIAAGGESAADIAGTLTAQINNLDWTAQGGVSALWAHQANAQIDITYARYGQVNTSGKTITFAAGQNFTGLAVGDTVRIGSIETTITTAGSNYLKVANDFGAQAGVPFLAARGGYDGNMAVMYALAKNANLGASVSSVKFSGGSSAATWRVTLDFTALAIDQVRQMWLTFAPRLSDSTAYSAEEWNATFTNWTVTDSKNNRALKVAAANSVRVEEYDYTAKYIGKSWAPADGFFSQGFAQIGSTIGDSVTVTYNCQVDHELWLGTSLYSDRGKFGVSMDGDDETLLDCYLAVEPAVVTRRVLRGAVAAGRHTVKLTVRASNPASAGNFTYFDFIEAAVRGDVPDSPGPFPLRSPAIDYDTDTTFKLSPQRLLWMFDALGFTGPMNEYLGVFWWNQRTLAGATFPKVTITVGAGFVDGDQIFLNIGGTIAGKTVFPADTPLTIAAHLAYFINETFSGVWAAVDGAALTVTSRSPTAAYNFTFAATKTSAGGTLTVKGNLQGGVKGTWVIDAAADPPLNYALQKWHADFYREVAARSLTVTTACSLELVNTPDDPASGQVWAARFPDGKAVETSTGFASLLSTQCAPMAANFLAYQIRVYLAIAKLQADAGLTPELQFGEFLWWFFSNFAPANPNGGMGYYDFETSLAAATALGRPLHSFISPNDDPTVNGSDDANFLAGRLRDHVAAIAAAIRAAYPTAVLEILWPYDVNSPQPTGRYSLGGRLNNWVNLPLEWKSKGALDRFKLEALDYGSGSRNLDLARTAIQYPLHVLSWPLDSIRYLFPVFNGGCPWEAEYLLALEEQIPATTPFAMDHVCLFGWRIEEPDLAPSAQLL